VSVDSALAAGRAAEEARQRDTCRITRPGTGTGPFNPETGQYDPPEPITVYEGPCRIPRRENLTGYTSNAGEASWQVGEFPLSLPVSGSGYVVGEEVKVGNTVTYLSSSTDSTLVGNVYGITEIGDQSQATARRFRMKRVTGLS
jgi:hypothetical protein